ncbi:MAG: hypothetical protein KJZ84_22040 [Bryobacteraceae bacterium]|nr:hypothetical protein [Bryobacteraceae bacterium]
MSIQLEPRQSGSRRLPGLLIVCTLAVLLSPAGENWKRKPVDSFPLSHYPMFSAKRAETYSAQTIYGIDSSGKKTVLPYRFAGTGGFNSVRRQLRVHVREKRADGLCSDVAARVSRSRRREHAGIREIRIATQTHNVGAFFAGERTPLSEKVHAVCEAPPRRAANESADNHLTLEAKDQPWSSN